MSTLPALLALIAVGVARKPQDFVVSAAAASIAVSVSVTLARGSVVLAYQASPTARTPVKVAVIPLASSASRKRSVAASRSATAAVRSDSSASILASHSAMATVSAASTEST